MKEKKLGLSSAVTRTHENTRGSLRSPAVGTTHTNGGALAVTPRVTHVRKVCSGSGERNVMQVGPKTNSHGSKLRATGTGVAVRYRVIRFLQDEEPRVPRTAGICVASVKQDRIVA